MNARFEFKAALAVDDAGLITGNAWPFGTPDRVGDEMQVGAFKSATAPLPLLFSHNPAEPLGAWDTIAETVRGLEVKGRLLVNEVARAREVHALVKAGAITGLSIGFSTKAATAKPGGGRLIKGVDLVEISLVTVPMHPRARVRSAKSAADAIALVDAINRAVAALKR